MLRFSCQALAVGGEGAGTAPGSDRSGPPFDEVAREVGEVDLGGRRCRVLSVDGLMPTHRKSPGDKGVRLIYVEGEIAHFELDGHRYALVVDGALRRSAPPAGDAIDPPTDIRTLLTSRELQVVQLVCMGYLTKQVADRLRISEFTVRSYLKAVYAKLGVRSRAAMVCCYMKACQAGTSAIR